jgi:hypothetical protein
MRQKVRNAKALSWIVDVECDVSKRFGRWWLGDDVQSKVWGGHSSFCRWTRPIEPALLILRLLEQVFEPSCKDSVAGYNIICSGPLQMISTGMPAHFIIFLANGEPGSVQGNLAARARWSQRLGCTITISQ